MSFEIHFYNADLLEHLKSAPNPWEIGLNCSIGHFFIFISNDYILREFRLKCV